MFDCDCTEAEALEEQGGFGYFPREDYRYDVYDRAEYVDKKFHAFSPKSIGKWCVVQKPKRKRNTISRLFLVDRNRTKRWWWSPDAFYAMVFDNESAARFQIRRYKYNKPKIMQITPAMTEYYEWNMEQ